LIGIICLSLYGFFQVEAYFHQQELESMLEVEHPHVTADLPKRTLREGDLFGRIEVPRLDMSVMVMEGVSDRTLRLGAGHIPGTPLGIAGHRDSFFRPLKDIRKGDTIKFATVYDTALSWLQQRFEARTGRFLNLTYMLRRQISNGAGFP